MGVAWFVAANRGDVLWAGGKADHQVHFGTHEIVRPDPTISVRSRLPGPGSQGAAASVAPSGCQLRYG